MDVFCTGPRTASFLLLLGVATAAETAARPEPVHHWPMDEDRPSPADGSTRRAQLNLVDMGTSDPPYPLSAMPTELDSVATFITDTGGGVMLSNGNTGNGYIGMYTGESDWTEKPITTLTFAATTGFTFAIWLKVNSFTDTQSAGTILALGDGGPVLGRRYNRAANYVYLQHTKGSRQAKVRLSAANGPEEEEEEEEVFTTPECNPDDPADDPCYFFPVVGVWAHVALTVSADDDPTWTLYRDGATQDAWTHEGSVGVNPAPSTEYHVFNLGRGPRTTHSAEYIYHENLSLYHDYFDGALRDARLYDTALSADDVAALTAPTSPPTHYPTHMPTLAPIKPTLAPSQATARPSASPSREPSASPSREPSASPSGAPSASPSASPTVSFHTFEQCLSHLDLFEHPARQCNVLLELARQTCSKTPDGGNQWARLGTRKADGTCAISQSSLTVTPYPTLSPSASPSVSPTTPEPTISPSTSPTRAPSWSPSTNDRSEFPMYTESNRKFVDLQTNFQSSLETKEGDIGRAAHCCVRDGHDGKRVQDNHYYFRGQDGSWQPGYQDDCGWSIEYVADVPEEFKGRGLCGGHAWCPTQQKDWYMGPHTENLGKWGCAGSDYVLSKRQCPGHTPGTWCAFCGICTNGVKEAYGNRCSWVGVEKCNPCTGSSCNPGREWTYETYVS